MFSRCSEWRHRIKVVQGRPCSQRQKCFLGTNEKNGRMASKCRRRSMTIFIYPDLWCLVISRKICYRESGNFFWSSQVHEDNLWCGKSHFREQKFQNFLGEHSQKPLADSYFTSPPHKKNFRLVTPLFSIYFSMVSCFQFNIAFAFQPWWSKR